jgi:histidine triad (HIT) family protein
MTYDSTNVFAKILRGEIPNRTVYENEYVLAFHDIAPAAPVHIVVIPKGEFRDFSEFTRGASPAMLHSFFASIEKIAAQQNLFDYRLITNNGAGAGQTVPHFHVHVLAGKPLGALLPA